MKMNIDISRTNHVSTREVHYATATVGKDTIENVEYIIFDHSDWWKPKEVKTSKDVLEKIWDVITTPFYRIKNKARDIYWEVRYGFQRMFKGYDSVDTFETFAKFIERYTKILTEYRNKHWGIPMEFIESEEKWDEVVDEMLYHLHYMDEETVIKEIEKDVPDDWSASHITVHEILEKHKDAFFELFSKYFYDLWD
jgi:hypothetical protein